MDETTFESFIEESVTFDALRPNCTIYNPCGSHGYCRHNFDGEWTCLCKFWWNGTTCDEMTDSGKQVIAAGVILGVLVCIFYGLKFFYVLKRLIKQRKEKQNARDFRRKNRPFLNTWRKRPSVSKLMISFIIVFFTLLLAATTLTVKWILTKRKHDEVIDKLNNDQALYFTRSSFCRVFDVTKDFNIIMFPMSILFFLIFTLATRRVSLCRNRCSFPFIGPPIPMDFFVHVRRLFAAMVFAIFADEFSEIFDQIFSFGRSPSSQGVIIRYLRQILKVLTMGFHRYPTLAAIYVNSAFSLACGAIYTWFDFALSIAQSGLCHSVFYDSDISFKNQSEQKSLRRLLDYYGTGSKLIVFQLIYDIPRYIFLSYICVKLVALLIRKLTSRDAADHLITREQKILLYSSLPSSIESIYIRKVLRMETKDQPENYFYQRFRFIYEWREDFRFSARIICVYAAIALVLYYVTVKAMIDMPPLLKEAQPKIQKGVDFIVAVLLVEPDIRDDGKSDNLRLPDLVKPYIGAICFTLLVMILQLIVMLTSMRRNLIQAFRGEYTEIPPPKISSHASYISGNFRFAGALIGFVILGYFFLACGSFIVTTLLATAIEYGASRAMERLLKLAIPFVLMIQVKIYINSILSQYVFLQHKLHILSINNRRVFMIFLYFNIFLDAFLGILSALIRIVQSVIGGFLYMSRLDYSPLGRKLEIRDSSYSSYCGFIYVECAHRHPILLCFVSHLLRDHLYGSTTKKWSKARRKWALAVFLLNNPKLIYQRKKYRNQLFLDDGIMALVNKKIEHTVHNIAEPIQYHDTTSNDLKTSDRF